MFKIVWDKERNGVKLTISSNGEALNISPRPVFCEELDLLGLNKMGWDYPATEYPLLWACDRKYFYKGNEVLEVKGGNIFDAPTIIQKQGFEQLSLEPIDMRYLRSINEQAMFILEHEAMDFIDQTYRRYKNIKNIEKQNPDIDFIELASNIEKKTKEKHVVVKEDCNSFDIMPLSKAEQLGKKPILNSKVEMFVALFSGGKDSQVVLDLVTRVIPSEDLLVIYSDTGYELPTSLTLYSQVEKIYKAKYPNLRFYTAKNHQDILYYWDEMGAPSRIHRWCCSVMKSAPLSRLLKDISGKNKQPHAILFDGVRAEESVKRANRSRIGVNAKHNNITNISPILDWNTTEIYLYLLFNNIPINESYRKGLSRVGCVICPYSSGWSEDLCGKLYSDKLSPFLDRIRNELKQSNTSNIENYIRTGHWKMRAGGRYLKNNSNVNFISTEPDFCAILTYPKENILDWLRIIGTPNITKIENSTISIDLIHKKHLFKCTIEQKEESIIFCVKNIDVNDFIFISNLKKISYKSTYCVHCEVCEVECPTGALSVTPNITIDENKCIHCMKCVSFDNKGCLCASSISTSDSNIINKNNNINMENNSKTGINRYNDGMGMRSSWLETYFSTYNTFFDNNEHGLNPKYQIPPFINWLRESYILSTENKDITEIGECLAKAYKNNQKSVWEIIFIGLCENSEICSWFHSTIEFEKDYTRKKLDDIIQESYPLLKDRTLRNPLNSLLNTFKESPLSTQIPVGVITKQSNEIRISRHAHNDISLVGLAYSLYRYAQKHERHCLTISEFYNSEQKEGVYRQFGINRTLFEQLLLSLQEEKNHVLYVELNMGLDNIILREDLKPIDIIKLMLL